MTVKSFFFFFLGFGLFHWILLVVCGWANASDAVEILCVSFLLPTARCDLNLSSSDMGLLTASIFLGNSAISVAPLEHFCPFILVISKSLYQPSSYAVIFVAIRKLFQFVLVISKVQNT